MSKALVFGVSFVVFLVLAGCGSTRSADALSDNSCVSDCISRTCAVKNPTYKVDCWDMCRGTCALDK